MRGEKTSAITSIRSLLPAIAEAGQLARQYYAVVSAWERVLKADRSVVTEADTSVEALCAEPLTRVTPGSIFSGKKAE